MLLEELLYCCNREGTSRNTSIAPREIGML